MSTVQNLKIVVSGDINQALQGLNKVGSAVQSLGRNITRSGRTLTRNFTVPLAAAGAAALAAGIRMGGMADELRDMEQQTGLTTDTLQEFRRVATVAGVDQDVLASAAEGLTRRLRAAGDESKTFAQNLHAIGISTRDADGNLREMDELMPAIMTRLQGIESITERNALAMQIFGRRSTELAPILGMTADEVQALREEAHELGLVLDSEALDAANQFRIEWQSLREQLMASVNELGLALIPVLSDVTGMIRDNVVPWVRRATEWVANLDSGTIKLVGGIAAAVAALGPLVLVIGKVVSVMGLVLTPMGLVIAGLASLAFTAGVVVKNWDVLKLQTALAWAAIKGAVFDAIDAMLGGMAKLAGFIPGLGGRVRALREDFNRFADESLAKSGRRIQELEREISAAGARTRDFGANVRDAAGDLFDFEGAAQGAADGVAAIFTTLKQQLSLADAMSALEIPGTDEARQKLSAYESALQALLREGFDPTDERVQGLAAKIRALSEEMERAEVSTERLNQMQREAEAIISGLMTPLEAHESHLSRLDELLEAGKLSLDQHNRAVERAQEAYEAATPAGQRMTELLQAQQQILAEIQTPQEALAEREALLNELREAGLLTLEEYNRALALTADRYEELEDPISSVGNAISSSFERGLSSVINFTTTSSSRFRQWATQLVADISRVIVKMIALSALSAVVPGGSFLASALSIPARAMGGPGRALRPHLVGERGPELFVPPASGQIHSAQRTGSMAGPSASEILAKVGPVPSYASPEVAATHDYYRRLFSAALPDARERGVDI